MGVFYKTGKLNFSLTWQIFRENSYWDAQGRKMPCVVFLWVWGRLWIGEGSGLILWVELWVSALEVLLEPTFGMSWKQELWKWFPAINHYQDLCFPSPKVLTLIPVTTSKNHMSWNQLVIQQDLRVHLVCLWIAHYSSTQFDTWYNLILEKAL